MDEFILTVDYNKTLDQMIADGQYGFSSTHNEAVCYFLFRDYKIRGKFEIAAKLFHFNRVISTEDAIKEIYKAGYRPATFPELLALGAVYPDLQREFPVIALDSIWHDNDYHDVSYLGSFLGVHGNTRELNLRKISVGFDESCRFLAIRKEN